MTAKEMKKVLAEERSKVLELFKQAQSVGSCSDSEDLGIARGKIAILEKMLGQKVTLGYDITLASLD